MSLMIGTEYQMFFGW